MIKQQNKKKSVFTRPLLILTLTIFVYCIGRGILEPFFPLYLKSIFGDYSKVGIIYGTFYLFSIVNDLVFGQIINRISKKKMINIILLLYAPIGFIILALKSLGHFLIYQIYHSFISAPLWISLSSYIRQNYRKKVYEAMGFFYSGLGMGLLLGALTGAFLIYKIGFSIIYLVSVAYSISFIISLYLPHKNKGGFVSGLKKSIFKDGIVVKEIKDCFKNRLFRNSIIFLFLFHFSTFFLIMVIPLFLRELNATYYTIGVVYSFFYAPMIFESYFSRIKHKKFTFVFSLLSISLIFFILYLIENIYIIFFFAFVIGVLIAVLHPLIKGKISFFMPKKEIGELTGVEDATTNIAAGLSLLIAGFLSDIYGIRTMFLIGSFILFTLSVLIYKNRLLVFKSW